MREINVGIDLGTTYSAIAHYDSATGKTEIFNNSYEKNCTPSVVYVNDGKVLIGEDAKGEQKAGNIDTAAFYKSMMADPNYMAYIDEQEYSAEDLSALFLKEFVKDIETTNDVKIKNAIITVPAYFNMDQKMATIRAGKRAGINVIKTINEPTAAIIAYGLRNNIDKNVLVYDLGGGTFDVTIARVSKGNVDVLVSNGDHQLGGKDWDDTIVSRVKEEFFREYGMDISASAEDAKELQVACEEAKQRLTNLSSTYVSVRCGGAGSRYEVTREDFEYDTEWLLDKTMMFVSNCFKELSEDTGKPFGWADIDDVILVGGSTRMPQVKERITREYGKAPVTRDINVDTIVATGAAIESELYKVGSLQIGGTTLSINSIQDITSHSLGMLALSSDNKYINSIILKKNSKVNTVFSKEYVASGDTLDVYVLQGESREPRNNNIIGKYVVSGMSGKSGNVKVNFMYDSSGIVVVTANMNDGTKLTVDKKEVAESIDELIAKLESGNVSSIVQDDTEVMLLIDRSGSMRKVDEDSKGVNRMEQAKRSAKDFVKEFDLAHTKLSIATFGDHTDFYCTGESNISAINSAIDGIELTKGVGNSENPIANNMDKFQDGVNKILVILTDGHWCHQVQEVNNATTAKAKGIIIYGIGIGDADEEFLRKISSGEGKKVNTGELSIAFKQVASSIAKEVGATSLM